MKKKHLLITLLSLISLSVFSQYTFFKYERESEFSYVQFSKEINGNYYIGGSYFSNSNYYPFADILLFKLDKFGNIIKKYNHIDSTISYNIFHIATPNDNTIRLFINSVDSAKTKLIVQDIDFNFNIKNEVSFSFKDTASLYMGDLIMDNDSNYVIIGSIRTHPFYTSPEYNHGVIFKLSQNLDSLDYYESWGATFVNIIENPYIDLYYITDYSYNFFVFNKNLDSIKKIRLDTFIPLFYSHLLLDTNKIAIIGSSREFFNNDHRPILIKTVDTLGNEYDRVEVDAPDTISTPGQGTMISKCSDSSSLYFAWKKNNLIATYCNNGEPSYIGVGKFDMDLNPIWIRYFGNDSVDYSIIHQTATSDGGVLVVGGFHNCHIMEDIVHYVVLKVDKYGDCTFIKELPIINNQLEIFPNPASNYIQISLKGQKEKVSSYQIYDIQGRIMKSEECNFIDKIIDIAELSKGVYVVEVKLESGGVLSKKFVKQ